MKKMTALFTALLFAISASACSYVPEITGIEATNKSIELMVSQSGDLGYRVLTEADTDNFTPPPFHSVDMPDPEVSFTSKDTSIAIVDYTGKIAAIAPGETSAIITITDEKTQKSFSAEVKVICKEYMTSLNLVPETLSVVVGEENDLASMCDEYTVWNALLTSSDDTVAVCEGSSIKATAPGDATITLTLGGDTHNIAFHSVLMATSYDLDHTELSGSVGEKETLKMASWQPDNANGGLTLTYSSSDEAVASVDSDGTVHFIAPGTATITAVNETGVKAECKVEVDEKAPSEGTGGLFLALGEGGKVDVWNEEGKQVNAGDSAKPATGTTNPGDYDRSDPAVAAVLGMVGTPYKCSQVAEAAANARGVTGWVDHGSYSELSPENFLNLGTRVPASQMRPGDILYYANGGWGISHVAVYIGNGMAVHGNFDTNGMTKIASATYTTLTSVIHID